MPALSKSVLHAQDTVHLLAKMRTNLNMLSNILILGNLTVCRDHLQQILLIYPKGSAHGINERTIDMNDKQNYIGIHMLVPACLMNCLNEMSTAGTVMYLEIMKDTFFGKSISQRILLIWMSVFFILIWSNWLMTNGYQLNDDFVTEHVCCLFGNECSYDVV